MSQTPRRWSEGGAQGAEEQKAAELFRAAQPVEPLSPESLARIEYGITTSMAAGAGVALWTKIVAGVAVAALGTTALLAVATRRGEDAPPPAPAVAAAPAQLEEAKVEAVEVAPPEAAPTAPIAEAPPRPRKVKAPVDPLAEEAMLMERAFRSLHSNPAEAIALTDEHRRRFPQGQLVSEANRIRLDALIALRRHPAAAQLAGELANDAPPARASELRLVQGEQLMALGKHREALSRFEQVIASDASGSTAERARYGRAACRRALGDMLGARRDGEAFLQQFPSGARAAEVRSWWQE